MISAEQFLNDWWTKVKYLETLRVPAELKADKENLLIEANKIKSELPEGYSVPDAGLGLPWVFVGIAGMTAISLGAAYYAITRWINAFNALVEKVKAYAKENIGGIVLIGLLGLGVFLMR